MMRRTKVWKKSPIAIEWKLFPFSELLLLAQNVTFTQSKKLTLDFLDYFWYN